MHISTPNRYYTKLENRVLENYKLSRVPTKGEAELILVELGIRINLEKCLFKNTTGFLATRERLEIARCTKVNRQMFSKCNG